MNIKKTTVYISIIMLIAICILCGCDKASAQNVDLETNFSEHQALDLPEETPFVRPSPKVLDLKGSYTLTEISRDGDLEEEALQQLEVLGLGGSIIINDDNSGFFSYMGETMNAAFHVLDDNVTITGLGESPYEIPYSMVDNQISFEWKGDLLTFQKDC